MKQFTQTKGWEYVINPDAYELIGTHWIAVYVNDNNVIYFDSLGVEHIPIEVKNIIKNIQREKHVIQ